MTASLVLREDRDGLATLTLHRPDKLNSLTVGMFEELSAHLDDLAGKTETIGAVLLRGAGRCFCAGNDISQIAAGARTDLQPAVISQLAALPQPVVAAVHGHCFTGGLELALAADIILASANARFADTHANWALTPMWGMSQRLPRRIGQAKAYEMMVSGRTYGGEAAAAMGLANLCFPDDGFDAGVEAFMADIIARSWFSHRINKATLRDTDGMTLADGLAHEIAHHPGIGPNAAERLAGFGKTG